MIAVLIDQGAQHVESLLLIAAAAHSAAAPRDLLPHQQPERVAALQHDARLLIVAEAHEVAAHVLDHLHFPPDQVFRHRGGESGVVLVALGAADQQTLAVQLEGAVLHEFVPAQAEALRHLLFAVRRLERGGAGVEMRGLGRPQPRIGDLEGAAACHLIENAPVGSGDGDGDCGGVRQFPGL